MTLDSLAEAMSALDAVIEVNVIDGLSAAKANHVIGSQAGGAAITHVFAERISDGMAAQLRMLGMPTVTFSSAEAA
jgi:hypothetical protein